MPSAAALCQLFTRFAIFSDPMPVARSNPSPVMYAGIAAAVLVDRIPVLPLSV